MILPHLKNYWSKIEGAVQAPTPDVKLAAESTCIIASSIQASLMVEKAVSC